MKYVVYAESVCWGQVKWKTDSSGDLDNFLCNFKWTGFLLEWEQPTALLLWILWQWPFSIMMQRLLTDQCQSARQSVELKTLCKIKLIWIASKYLEIWLLTSPCLSFAQMWYFKNCFTHFVLTIMQKPISKWVNQIFVNVNATALQSIKPTCNLISKAGSQRVNQWTVWLIVAL